MSETVTEGPRPGTGLETPVRQRLSTLDRFLPVWIVAATAAGLLLGRLVPGLDDAPGRGRSRRRQPFLWAARRYVPGDSTVPDAVRSNR